jgi:hypothetical protein
MSVEKYLNIYECLAAINSEVGVIGKESTNKIQNFKYRGIDAVMAELHGLFSKYGVVITQKVLDRSREERPSRSGGLNIWSIATYEFTFSAKDGSYLSTQMIGEAMDSGDKGNNKCVSIALKYALVNLFTIPTEEQKNADPDGYTHDVAPKQAKITEGMITQDQVDEIVKITDRKGISKEVLKKYLLLHFKKDTFVNVTFSEAKRIIAGLSKAKDKVITPDPIMEATKDEPSFEDFVDSEESSRVADEVASALK